MVFSSRDGTTHGVGTERTARPTTVPHPVLGVEVGAENLEREDLKVDSQDFINVTMILVPIVIVVVSLIQGLSAAGVGMSAFFAIIPLSFLNPEVRAKPLIIFEALSHAGLTFG